VIYFIIICSIITPHYLLNIHSLRSINYPKIICIGWPYIGFWGIIQAYKIRDFSRDIATQHIDFFDTLFTKNKKMRHSYL